MFFKNKIQLKFFLLALFFCAGFFALSAKNAQAYAYSANTISAVKMSDVTVNFGTISWTEISSNTGTSPAPADSSIVVGVRAGDTTTADGTWTNGGDWTIVTNGQSLAFLGAKKNIQYQVTFSYDGLIVPGIADLTISHSSYPKNQTATTSVDFTLANEGNFVQQDAASGTDFSDSMATLYNTNSNFISGGSGGTITNVGGYTIHKFTSSGTFTSAESGDVEVLVVAGGGGGGGSYDGAGGGGGGLIYNSSFAVSSGAIDVTVGGGGAGGGNRISGSNGNNSVFSSITAIGGGGGATQNCDVSGKNGGSGGGAASICGTATFGLGTSGQGNNGGLYVSISGSPAGGGGGAGAVGGNGYLNHGGNGGNGLEYSISGTPAYYAGGGGGSTYSNPTTAATAGLGGIGGGGAGARGGDSCTGGTAPTAGTVNTGGGGGGAERCVTTTGAMGGSGIVIVRYPNISYPISPSYITTSPTSQKNTSTWGHINEVILTQDTPTNTTLKYLVSFDNRNTWKYWNGSAWTNSSLDNLETEGMVKTTVEAITQAQWEAAGGFVISANGTLDFAASLKTTDATVTPTLSNINVAYEILPPAIVSTPYDTTSQANILNKILWTENLPAQTDVKFQLRSSADGNTWTSWMGTDGTSSTYFTAPDGSETLPIALTDSTDDQWIQYKAFLTTSDTSVTPTLSDVSLKYVVNAKPEFNPDFPTTGVGGMSAIQNESGSIAIDFSVRDPDTTEGTATPNLLTPSYYYSLDNGANYVQITSGLSAGASNPKTVEEVNFLNYSITWNAAEQLGNNVNIADAKIRVVVTDNEAGPNTTQKDSSAFTLNTMVPVLGAVPIKVDASVTPAIVTLDATDATPLEMKVSTSPTLVGAEWEPYNATKEITLASTPATVYFQVKNANSFTSVISSATTPEVPASAMVQDTSNLDIVPSEFRLFVAWKVAALPDPGFGSYKIYRSTDQTNWTLIDTVPNRLTNYYGDNSVSGDTNYYYKVTTIDSDGNISAYSEIVNGKANGIQDAGEGGGGTTPSTQPVISAVSVSSITSTTALVSWDTDTISNSMVAYIDETGGDFSDARVQGIMTMANNTGGIGKHNLTLTNLSPNKTYYLKLQSIDASGQTGESVQGTDGYSFTTANGSAITNVEITVLGENEARINWTTSVSVPSSISYSENHIGATLTEPIVFEDQKKETTHSKVISNLTRGIPYYFTIRALDDDGGETIADNAGLLYSFTTDIDTAGPTITTVLSPMVTINQAAITWVTNEDATSQVKYSTTAGGPYTTLTEETTLQKGHTYIISDLDNVNSNYYYKVISRDIYGNDTTSAEYSFPMPLDASLNHPPLETITFEDVNPSMLTDTAAVISFETDQVANCFVEYGASPSSYTYVPVQEKEDTYNKSHAIALTGMLFSTKHYYKVTCKDNLPDAVAVSSDEKDFTTLDKMIAEGSITGGDNLPPTISNVKVSNIIGEGATITWDTDEKGNSTVRYGIANISESGAIDSIVNSDIDNYVTTHSVVLTGLVPGTKYLYVASSTDAAGNIAQSSESSFTTASPSSISSIKVESKNLGTATVSWETDQETTSTVEYGLSTSYGDKKENSAYATEHSINLSGLNQGAVYHYRVKGKDKDGRFFASSDNTFEPKSPAKITDVAINSVTEHGAIIVFKTNVPTDSNVSYANVKDGQKTGSQGARELSTDHKIELANLDQGSTFALTIAVRDEQGTESTLKAPDLTTGQDQAAPKIDNIKTDSALTQSDKVQAIISWKTDEQATTSILYKEGRNGEEKEIKITDNLTNNHIGVITVFKPGTVYNFKVKSIDASGNEAISNDFALLAPKRRENIIQIIIGNFTDIFGWAKF
ncbi:MAG TPA: hypothetical protein DIT56_02995 [Candidatus Moranbacteria bacterium]|nr:hypothetical protein [Candidatus Moranbacteria bacterium]